MFSQERRTALDPLIWRPPFYHYLPLKKSSTPSKPQPFHAASNSPSLDNSNPKNDSVGCGKGLGLCDWLLGPFSCCLVVQRKGNIVGKGEEGRRC